MLAHNYPRCSHSATFEFPVAETGAPEPAKKDDDKQASVDKDDDVKPDFGQSDNVDVDPNQGAINMGFDDKDEAPKGGKDKEDEEETKF
ncbi:hypothetical protein OS493_016434 [Desmophyllum pertusum]|uniref:Uncharacterized protein n=1 Tax=Desmophyllum pertusum TaxID=174260 RepID=A0A9W9ZP95_9CNID|nr:hypothetical protein OS493_016434 [Desmophyllum pertusum]